MEKSVGDKTSGNLNGLRGSTQQSLPFHLWRYHSTDTIDNHRCDDWLNRTIWTVNVTIFQHPDRAAARFPGALMVTALLQNSNAGADSRMWEQGDSGYPYQVDGDAF